MTVCKIAAMFTPLPEKTRLYKRKVTIMPAFKILEKFVLDRFIKNTHFTQNSYISLLSKVIAKN